MMEPDLWPFDPQASEVLVLRTVDEIDSSSEEARDELLGTLLSYTWGSILAQNQ